MASRNERIFKTHYIRKFMPFNAGMECIVIMKPCISKIINIERV